MTALTGVDEELSDIDKIAKNLGSLHHKYGPFKLLHGSPTMKTNKIATI